MMVSWKVALPLQAVLLAVRSQFSRVILFLPSIHTPSDRLDTRVAFLTVISAVDYIAGDPRPLDVYVPPSTTTVPPPRSVRIGTEEPPEVVTVRLLA